MVHGSCSTPRHCLLLLGQRIPLGKDDPMSLAKDKFVSLGSLGIAYSMLIFYIPLPSVRVETELKIRKKWNNSLAISIPE